MNVSKVPAHRPNQPENRRGEGISRALLTTSELAGQCAHRVLKNSSQKMEEFTQKGTGLKALGHKVSLSKQRENASVKGPMIQALHPGKKKKAS